MNVTLFEQWLSDGTIRLGRGKLLAVEPAPKRPHFDFGRVEGMMLGLAIGDSLGNSSESLPPSHRRQLFGEVRDYRPHADHTEIRGYPSDDSQLAFWTLEQLVTDGAFLPERVAQRFAHGRIFGIGQTVRGFLRNLKSGVPWQQSGPESAGNGALMRIAPILVPHLRAGGRGLWADTVLAAMMTHNDRSSTATCLAFVAMLWDLLDMETTPAREWWLDRFVELAADLEGDTRYSPRGGRFADYRGPLWRYALEGVRRAEREGLSTVEACDAWYSGAYLMETLPCVLLILTRYADDPETAIIRAVNDTRDNDTAGAIVGAAVGALHGRSSLPERWVNGLSGRTAESDDGRMFQLLEQTRSVFWPRTTGGSPCVPVSP